MAKRQDSGSNSAHENERPTSHNEDALPEMTGSGNRGDDRVRSAAESEDDEFEDTEDLDDEVEDDGEEGDI
jgi:hypothetical protein